MINQIKKLARYLPFVMLIIIWLILVLIHIVRSDISFSVITKKGSGVSNHNNYKEILAKQKVTGYIQAYDNYLGIVALRFNTAGRRNQDAIVFRLKQKGDSGWYFQNTYNTFQFGNNKLYPFGFPTINDSKGKSYYFEVESTAGSPGNAVAISTHSPNIITQYQFPRQVITSSKKELLIFLYKKFISAIENHHLLPLSIIYLSPLILYILIRKKMIPRNSVFSLHPNLDVSLMVTRYPLVSFFLILTLIWPFLIGDPSHIFFIFIIVWLILLKRYRVQSRLAILFGAILFLLSIFFSTYQLSGLSEKFQALSYIYLAAGIILAPFEVQNT